MRPVSVRIMHPEPGPTPVRSRAGSRIDDARSPSVTASASRRPGPPTSRSSAGHPTTSRSGRDCGLWSGRSDRPDWWSWAPAPFRWQRLRIVERSWRPRRASTGSRWPTTATPADVVAIARAEALANLPDLPGDNALPRWLTEVAGYEVNDLRGRWRLAIDIDGPLELILLGERAGPAGVDLEPLRARLARVRAVAATGEPSSW